ncbi:hypothetical protein MAM1_0113d05609 [Mucor ambiguus]|uniref:Uncharacterized protein n=1 Tax=Mucor ambiguus TaxID=91626 RepID=A0A0C9MS27_9FUNG|nr:hypothetical protein MAM1_0113d05609 [Mucor ambiguus]
MAYSRYNQASAPAGRNRASRMHLTESTLQVDTNNRIKFVTRANVNSTTAATTSNMALGEAMVMEAKKLLEQIVHANKGAGQGAEAEAQFLLGNCYSMGVLASYYRPPEATYRTVAYYEIGIDTSKDEFCALTFYRKAAHLMHVPAMYKLDVILMRGYCDHPISRREAVVWLQRAACTVIAPLSLTEKSKATTIGGHASIALPHALHALAIVHLARECERTSMIPDPKYD